MKEEKKRTLLHLLGIGATIGAGSYAAISYQIFKNIFNLEKSEYTKNIYWCRNNINKNETWFLNSQHTDEYLMTYDHIRLHALNICNHIENHKWIIILHDYHQCALQMMDILYEFDQMGFNLFVPDARACGLSKGKYTGLGWSEHFDLHQWINHLLTIDNEAEIYLYGLGMGASTILYTLGDYLPSNVKVAITDSGYANLKEILEKEISKKSRFSGPFFIKGVDFFVKQNLHYSLQDISLIERVAKSKIPVLFLCAGDDDMITPKMSEVCYNACGCAKDFKIYPNCKRNETWKQLGYFDNIKEFILQNYK